MAVASPLKPAPNAPARQALNGGAMLYDPTVLARPDEALFDPLTYGDAAQPVSEGGRQAAWFVTLGYSAQPPRQAGAAASDGVQGANRSGSRRYREDLQRSRPPEAADARGAAGYAECPLGGAQASGNVQAVLRHYRRGGLMAKLGRREYIWLGESRTRSFAEFRLMHAMHASGLPVPRPLAAACWRSGLRYRAAILVERIAGASPLASVLNEPVESAVAQAIARMHRAGVWHADLNAHNILLDPTGLAWLIDFDRGRGTGISDKARLSNLARLRRSLEKIAGEPGLALWQRIDTAYRAVWPRL